ncbi:SDR family NAD(P)-dependent oxidoreductase [Sphaerospermopsis aphanizomenoides BCCUSP55]|uniref:SDR family oxidoreductase n=1 Tax=Sphaerospermopsis aphanizomenoides TaxID=459663 RepID=UPI000B0449C1|nr:SDR family NAD(P)-dependent oxidoreductase [Sphaerospermopsis aphanizomenoides]MBK1990727.1 SDR family NAD(P)-dependent oxidoreductase [Sphaerospermopsis aphanizomenoides BCCUSP55]
MQDKVILIVGATGGIGSALARQLAPTGAKLVLAARNEANLATLAGELSGEVLTVSTDITQPEQVNALIQATLARFGQIDVLVNAAGMGILKPYNSIEPAELEQILDLNLKGCFYTTKAAAQEMQKRKSGHICNVVGILGKHSMGMAAAYSASKFGVVGFSKSMAEELKRFGVKFTLFYFGGVDSPFWDNVTLKVDRTKMLSCKTAANAIFYALSAEPQAVPMEINIQPDSHLFF